MPNPFLSLPLFPVRVYHGSILLQLLLLLFAVLCIAAAAVLLPALFLRRACRHHAKVQKVVLHAIAQL
jgi:hypothetical protein